MGQHGGHNTPVDSSGWKRPISSHRNGDSHPAPAETRINPSTGTSERTVTPEPEASAIRRNFSRSSR